MKRLAVLAALTAAGFVGGLIHAPTASADLYFCDPWSVMWVDGLRYQCLPDYNNLYFQTIWIWQLNDPGGGGGGIYRPQ